MNVVANAEEENRGSSPADPVLVLQVMGRRIGFIPAAAASAICEATEAERPTEAAATMHAFMKSRRSTPPSASLKPSTIRASPMSSLVVPLSGPWR